MMNTFQQPTKRYKYSTPTLIDTSTSSSTSSAANDSTVSTSTTPPLSPNNPTVDTTTTPVNNSTSSSILQSNILGNKFNKIANFSSAYVAAAAVANCNQMINKNYYNHLQANNYENYPPMQQQQPSLQQHQQQQQQYYNNYYNNTNNLQNRSNCSSGRSSLNSNATDSSLSPLTTPSPTLRQQQQQQQSQNPYDLSTAIPCQLNNDTTNAYRNTTNLLTSSNIANINANMNSSSLPLKKRRAIPSEMKDNSYWEKRRKNNESAKRSRDNKRSKEETLVMRNLYLEQENLQLKTQIAMYEAQIENLSRLAHGLGGHIINSNTNN